MSWQDQVKIPIEIILGDGKSYSPLYFNSPKSFDFNIAEFEFPHIEGTLVKRGKRKGSRISIDLFFQGENHLDMSLQFEQSSKDERHWRVMHPMHGELAVQPASLTFDNTSINVTKITAVLIETITNDAPRVVSAPKEQVIKNVENFQETVSAVSADKLKDASSSDKILLGLNLGSIYDEGKKFALSDLEANDYFNLYTTAIAKINAFTASPLLAMTAMNAMIAYPANFLLSVKERINLLVTQYNALVDGIEELVTPNEKNIFEGNAAAIISAMAESAVTPLNDSDYGNMVDVLDIIDQITGVFDSYLSSVSGLQTDNGWDEDAYIPNYEVVGAISDLVNYAVSNLFIIAIGAKQERIIFLEQDSNLIILAHRFYGLEPNDSTIQEFIRNNKIGISEHLLIKKDRQLKYYVG